MLKSNLRQIIRKQERRRKDIPGAFARGAERTMREARQIAREASGAHLYNPRTFKGRARPYSRRMAGAHFPPYLINRQGGGFQAGWKVSIRRGKGETTATLYNDSKVAPFMTARGTRSMIGRPIREYVAGQTKGKPLRYTREELHKAMRGS